MRYAKRKKKVADPPPPPPPPLADDASEPSPMEANAEALIEFLEESQAHVEYRDRKGERSKVKLSELKGINPKGLLTRYYQFTEHVAESDEFPVAQQRRGGGYLMPMMCAIRDAMLDRDWESAGLAVYHLVNRLNDCYPYFWHIWWKIMVEVTRNHPDATKASFDQMLRKIKIVTAKDIMEILLDQLQHLINEGRLDDAMEALSEDMATKHVNKDERYHLMTIRIAAAEGIIHYAFWKRKLAQMNAHGSAMLAPDKREFEMYALKAVSFFQNVLDTPGPWDICVRYSCEILEEQGEFEQMSQMLNSYIEMNPNHGNAYKFLYYFLKSREPNNKKRLISVLKKVARLNPYDDLVFDLCLLLHEKEQKRIRQKKPPTANRMGPVEYLFDLLDSEITNHREDYWRLLLSFIEEGIYVKPLKAAWKERKSWWPHYVFRPSSVEYGASQATLFMWRGMCSLKLMGKGSLYAWSLLEADVLDPESRDKLESMRKKDIALPEVPLDEDVESP